MTACITLLNSWALFVGAIGVAERIHLQERVERSHTIAVGDSEADVKRLLSKPRVEWEARRGLASAIFGERPRQWVYGTAIDLRIIVHAEPPFVHPLPVKLRLFSADEDDLVIDWSPEDTVAHVARPDLHVPPGAVKILKPIYFVSNLVRILNKQ